LKAFKPGNLTIPSPAGNFFVFGSPGPHFTTELTENCLSLPQITQIHTDLFVVVRRVA